MSDGKRTMADIFQEVFGTEDGKTMLYWIASECGMFQEDPGRIRPDLMAFWHRLLRAGGVTDPRRAGVLMQNIMATARKPLPKDTRSDEYGQIMGFLDD